MKSHYHYLRKKLTYNSNLMLVKNNFCKAGYSLLEQALSIGILSIIVASGALYFEKKDQAEKREETERRMSVIEDALAAYYLDASIDVVGSFNDGQFPCPASPDLDPFNSNYAKEVLSGNNCTATSPINLQDGYYYGVVPTRTLQLPDYYALDGWGRKFSFVVDKSHMPNLGTEWSDSDLDEVLYHLISHGENGLGAYGVMGAKIRNATGDELNNSISASDYINIADKPHSNSYDDLVISRTGLQFISLLAGEKLLDENFCSIAKQQSSTGSSCNIMKAWLQILCIKYGATFS